MDKNRLKSLIYETKDWSELIKTSLEINNLEDDLINLVNSQKINYNFFNIFNEVELKKLNVIIFGYEDLLEYDHEKYCLSTNIVEKLNLELQEEYKKKKISYEKLKKQGVLFINFLITSGKNKLLHINLWSKFWSNMIKLINEKHKYTTYLLLDRRLVSLHQELKEIKNVNKKTDDEKRKTSCHISFLIDLNNIKNSNCFISINHYLKEWRKNKIMWFNDNDQ